MKKRKNFNSIKFIASVHSKKIKFIHIYYYYYYYYHYYYYYYAM